jgi:heptosyltransferase-3
MSDAISFTDVSRALVIKLRHHGDVLLAAPVFTALQRAAPQCRIDALIYAETLPMLQDHPAIDRIHVIDRNWKRQGTLAALAAEWALLGELRTPRYDLVIHLTEHRRGAWLTRLIGPRWSVAPRHAGDFWAGSFTHLYGRPRNGRRHAVECNLDALRRLGLPIIDADRGVALVPGTAAQAAIDERLTSHGLGRDFVHIHAASRWRFKCWPAEKFAALADALAERGLPVVLTAAPDPAEQALVADIVRHAASQPLDLSGRLSLKELAALTARAKLFVGVDSAPMHMAAAMGTPVVALFGPSGELDWGPWGTPRRGAHRVVASTLHPCRPCGIDGCGGGKISECLTTLPVAAVLAAIDAQLAS